jgi:small-conductance mechanosensitive channel
VVPNSDAREVERILLASVAEAAHVMKHPAPSVIFRAIGEAKLDFELRCFVSDTDYYLPTLSALNFAIDAAMQHKRIQPVGPPTVSLQPALEEFARQVPETA